MSGRSVLEGVRGIAARFAQDRHDRQRRDSLDSAEFDELADAGFLLTGVPSARGGLFESAATSARTIGEILRALAWGDASVALVASMHPAVLSFWHASPDAPAAHSHAWREQSAWLSDLA